MQFGFTLKPDHTIERTLALASQAEAAGFELRLAVRLARPVAGSVSPADPDGRRRPRTLRLGTCVTNPATREPSVTASTLAVLNELSRRADGPGHRPRRLRAAGPGQAADDDEGPRGGGPRHPRARRGPLDRVRGHDARAALVAGRIALPVWIAGYGPVALRLTGRVADGVMLQIGDPDLIRWFVSQVRDVGGAPPVATRARVKVRRRRRRTSATSPTAATGPAGSRRCRQPRRRSRQQVPARGPARGAHDYVRDREGYDYLHHAEVGSSNAPFVTDEIVDRFCLVGERGRAHRAAAGPRRGGRRPVQPLPDERERGGAAGAVRARGHPGAARRGRPPGSTGPACSSLRTGRSAPSGSRRRTAAWRSTRARNPSRSIISVRTPPIGGHGRRPRPPVDQRRSRR